MPVPGSCQPDHVERGLMNHELSRCHRNFGAGLSPLVSLHGRRNKQPSASRGNGRRVEWRKIYRHLHSIPHIPYGIYGDSLPSGFRDIRPVAKSGIYIRSIFPGYLIRRRPRFLYQFIKGDLILPISLSNRKARPVPRLLAIGRMSRDSTISQTSSTVQRTARS